ncbi:MAG: HDIG domain-containing protein [FCB group bacterium]|nr:HDIG domain-containing protein [FCB group bacterium]
MKRRPDKLPLSQRLNTLARRYWPQTLILFALVFFLSLFFPRGTTLKYSYKLDDIAREQIIAPFTFPILKSEEKYKADLEEAIRKVPFVFKRDQALVDEQIKAIDNFFSLAEKIRAARRRLNQSKDLVYRYRYEPQYKEAKAEYAADSTALATLLETFYQNYTFDGDPKHLEAFLELPEANGPKYDLEAFKEDILQICRDRWAEGIYNINRDKIISDKVSIKQGEFPILADPEEFQDLHEARIKATEEVAKLYQDEKDPRRLLWDGLLIEFMKPNLVYDAETTERHQQEAIKNVPRFQATVLENERIVDKNTRITEDILLKLESLSLAMSKRQRAETSWDWFLSYLGRVIVIAVVLSFFFTFLLIYRTHIYDDWRMMLLIALIFITEMGLAHLVVMRLDLPEYLVPITVAAMILTILFDARIGFMGTTSLAILTGIMIGNNMDFVVVAMLTSTVAMYNVRQLRTRSQIFTTIFSLIGASILGAVGLGMFKNSAWEIVQMDLMFLLIMSVLAPIVTYGLIGPLEIAFRVTTDFTLLELLDFNHPLLKRLQREANGTFNHSVVVGNLAEACANAIGARSLLSRVGAYYHDIGKMTRPEYFIENQYTGVNRHDNLTPVMSAKIIKNHVKDGLKLAEEYGLPKIVSDFIPMHHGTTLTEYFYRKALDQAEDPSQVDDTIFRYPGPKPNTKETGILMICEAVEAAVRSIKNPDIFKIEEMIDKIIRKRVEGGQLAECPLTLDELRRIKGTVDGAEGMLPVLRGIYHIRIEYPDEKSEDKKKTSRTPKA